jgi:hypothetical protein
VFLSTTGDVLNDAQQAAFERYIRAGHGFGRTPRRTRSTAGPGTTRCLAPRSRRIPRSNRRR